MGQNSDDKWKYIYVKRRLYDSFIDRNTQKMAMLRAELLTLRDQLSDLEDFIDNHAERLHALEARKGK